MFYVISCRNLISSALRKKHFHKETIRVEEISSGEPFDSNEPWSGNWLKWDLISSGDGDLQLDDMAKSFAASSKISKTVKTVDFAFAMDSMPSCGFQVKDLMSVAQSDDSCKNILSAAETIKVSVATNEVSENPSRLDILHETDLTSLENAPSDNRLSGCENDRELNLPTDCTEAVPNVDDGGPHPTITKEELKNSDVADKLFTVNQTERDDQNSQNCVSSCEVDLISSKGIIKCWAATRESELGAAHTAGSELEGDTRSNAFGFPACQNDESKSFKSSDAELRAENVAMVEIGMEIDTLDQEDTSVALDNMSLSVIEGEHFRESLEVVSDQNPHQGSHNEMDNKDDPSVANHETEVTMEEQRDGDQLSEPGDGKLIVQESCIEMMDKNDSLAVNHEAHEEVTVEEQRHGDQFRELGERVIPDKILFPDSSSELRVKDGSSYGNEEELEDVKREEQIHGAADSEINCPALVQCVSGTC